MCCLFPLKFAMLFNMISFNKNYFFLAVLLFLTEILIALYVHDQIIRPYGGDFLVVMLIYCFLKSFMDTGRRFTAIGVLVFSYVIEVLQYFHIVNILGLENNSMARVVIGTSFAWTDILPYTLGIIAIVIIEKIVNSL